MFSIYTVSFITLLYLGLLFLIAFYGNRKKSPSPLIYSLALGVHCTSWAFFGTTTQASQFGWAFVPTYLGVILVMLFAFPVVCKVAKLCRQHNISSLADFIGIRYQHSHFIAGLFTLICFIGVVPYIALQLDAITLMLGLITKDSQSLTPSIGFYVVLLMALFAIVFGARTLDLTEKHTGLMYTIAFESLAKLIGLTIVGIYVCYFVFDGYLDVFVQAAQSEKTKQILQADFSVWIFASHVLLGICSMFCLPRQFHVNFIENNNDTELIQARWLFPLFLVLMSLFVLPLALAGNLLLDTNTFSTDSFALSIPVHLSNEFVSIASYVGGLSGSTSMVIVATLALGVMVSNSLITPLWLSTQVTPHLKKSLAPTNILRIRQITVIVVLSIAYWYHLNISQSAPLVKSGFVALSLLAQMFPALIFGLYWSRANKIAAISGTLVGAGIWVHLVLYPSILSSYYFEPALSDAELANGFYIAFICNTFVFISMSFLNKKVPSTFTNPFLKMEASSSKLHYKIPLQELTTLIAKVIPQAHSFAFKQHLQTSVSNDAEIAPTATVAYAQSLLSSHLGNAGARILLSAMSLNKKEGVDELSEWVEQASQNFQFNHELLQSSVAHIPQGISVINAELRLIAWNKKYEEIFAYPQHFLRINMPLIDILKYNARRGLIVNSESQEHIQKRISHIKAGTSYKYLRDDGDGRVIEIIGSPLPGGGFVTSYNDISEYINIQRELEDSKSVLETRVEERTAELNYAKLEAETANTSKTKFLAAAGHDLMQPFNAASLFASMLHQRLQQEEVKELTTGLISALDNADQILSMLLDMTKLESGLIKPKVDTFLLDDVLQNIANEYRVVAEQKGLTLKYVKTSLAVKSDKRLLNRIVQNLVTNAIRYTARGKILIGARRSNNKVKICVVDTGRGISSEQKRYIFEEFKQLNADENNQGIGLGLTIVDKMTQLLNHDVEVHSVISAGTQFIIHLEQGKPVLQNKRSLANNHNEQKQFLLNKQVLIIENEPLIVDAMRSLFAEWGATVFVAKDSSSALKYTNETIDLILADYHLDNADTGVLACSEIFERRKIQGLPQPIAILSSADRSELVREAADNIGMLYLPKPIKPLALKRMLAKVINSNQSI